MRVHRILLAVATFATAASAGQLGPLITANDYPPEALRNHWQGSVVVDLTISREGRVTACKVAKSSGHQILDETTCKIVTERAHFKPATDRQGQIIETHLTLPPIGWFLTD